MVPPFVGVAVNVTEVPAQIGPEGTAVIVTDGTTAALIIKLTPLSEPITAGDELTTLIL